MPKNKQQRLRKRRRDREKHWDMVATKSLLIGPKPAELFRNVGETLRTLNIPWSTTNRTRYQEALLRAVGAAACSQWPFSGTHTGKWKSCQKSAASWIVSNAPRFSQASSISHGTSTPSIWALPLLPGTPTTDVKESDTDII